nr:MAG TPA: hypothetical protein [Caudoviricetes sp.]
MLYNKSIRALDYATPTHGFFILMNMNDYKEILKTLLLQYYSPQEEEHSEQVYKSTLQVLKMALGVLPTEPIDQHDVYEALTELGFPIELVSEVEEETYLWKMYRKTLQ